MADLASVLEKEREKLNASRTEALQRRQAIDDEIAGIDKELKAIAAYEQAKTGKVSAPRQQRTRQGGRQEGIIQLLKDKPDGMGRSDILEALGLKGNKAGEQSISNALATMKKAGKIGAKDGRYTAA